MLSFVAQSFSSCKAPSARAVWSAVIAIATVVAVTACEGANTDAPPPAAGVAFAARQGTFPTLVRVRDAAHDPTDIGDVGEIAVSGSGVTATFRDDTAGLVLETYAASGERLATISRRGEGPGEFRMSGYLSFAGDTLTVVSPGRPVLLRFLSSGAFVDQVRTSGRFSSGMAVTRGKVYFAEYGRGGVVGIGAESIATGAVQDVFSRQNDFFKAALTADSGPRTVRPAFAVGPDVLYLGIGSEYRIAAFDDGGTLLAQFGRSLPPAGRGPRGLARLQAALELAASEPSPGIGLVRSRLDSVEREVLPFFGRGSFAVDGMGRLWVAGRDGDSTFLDVFAGNTFLGRHEIDCLRSPGGFSLRGRFLALRCALPPEDELYALRLFRIDG